MMQQNMPQGMPPPQYQQGPLPMMMQGPPPQYMQGPPQMMMAPPPVQVSMVTTVQKKDDQTGVMVGILCLVLGFFMGFLWCIPWFIYRKSSDETAKTLALVNWILFWIWVILSILAVVVHYNEWIQSLSLTISYVVYFVIIIIVVVIYFVIMMLFLNMSGPHY